MLKTSPHILRIAIASPLRKNFDYLPPLEIDPDALKEGARVLVPFGTRKEIGILVGKSAKSEVEPAKLKRILKVIDQEPLLSESMMSLCFFASEYYHHPLGDVLLSAMPKLLREGRMPESVSFELKNSICDNAPALELNAAQKQAITAISENLDEHKIFLLDGVTGSGKTEVYLRIIEKVIANGKQALVLVPEIGLTPQTVARFSARFPKCDIAVLHSKLTDKTRLNAWWQARQGIASIVIGTRSALFTPLACPGVIVLDEEHDLSFKQQAGFRYSARDLATMRSKLEKIPLILGSATPSFESLNNALQKRYSKLDLPDRVGSSSLPKFHLIDIRKQRLKGGLSLSVIQTMERHLSQGGQVLLFINRRGYAPSLICHHCGWTAGCEKCDANLTLHQNPAMLCCHHCGSINKIPAKCPNCQNQDLIASGLGSERIEIALKKLFPTFKVSRIDSDTTRRKGTLEKALQEVMEGDAKILVGTQMLTKGHHFPEVTMVVIVNADSGLFSANFRASEHLAQLITQVAGRAGRAQKPGEVYIQTHNPDHPLLQKLIHDGYQGFSKACLKERKEAQLPPFVYSAIFRAESKNKELAHEFLQKIKTHGRAIINEDVRILGPVAAIIERKANRYHAQVLVHSKNRIDLHNTIKGLIEYAEKLPLAKRLKWSIDIDPIEF